jgi:hypothetical protein
MDLMVEQEVEQLRYQLLVLIWDETCGMWTRDDFLHYCRSLNIGARHMVVINPNDR